MLKRRSELNFSSQQRLPQFFANVNQSSAANLRSYYKRHGKSLPYTCSPSLELKHNALSQSSQTIMNILKIAEEVKKMNISSMQRRSSKTNLQKIMLARIGESINNQIGS